MSARRMCGIWKSLRVASWHERARVCGMAERAELSITILPLRNGLLLLRGKIDHAALARPPMSGGGNN